MVPFSASLFENTHIFAQIFSSETKIVIFICKFCLPTANRVCQYQRTVYEYVKILFNQVYEWIIFFNWLAHRTKITLKLHPPPPTVCKGFQQKKLANKELKGLSVTWCHFFFPHVHTFFLVFPFSSYISTIRNRPTNY